jgi:hypothetical protein
MSDLAKMMAAAQRRAVEHGYSSRGTRRVLITQRFELCKPEHERWHPLGDATVIRCAVCHPPAVPHVLTKRLEAA